jgi:hypothetical protein
MSGEAFKMNHDLPSLETAIEAWVRGFVATSPRRAR